MRVKALPKNMIYTVFFSGNNLASPRRRCVSALYSFLQMLVGQTTAAVRTIVPAQYKFHLPLVRTDYHSFAYGLLIVAESGNISRDLTTLGKTGSSQETSFCILLRLAVAFRAV